MNEKGVMTHELGLDELRVYYRIDGGPMTREKADMAAAHCLAENAALREQVKVLRRKVRELEKVVAALRKVAYGE